MTDLRPQLCSLAIGSQSRGDLYFFITSVRRMSSSLVHPYDPGVLDVPEYGDDKMCCCEWLGPALGTIEGGARNSGGGWKPPRCCCCCW